MRPSAAWATRASNSANTPGNSLHRRRQLRKFVPAPQQIRLSVSPNICQHRPGHRLGACDPVSTEVTPLLGLRNKEEALALRARILTYAVWLGREARAAGLNACYDDPEARRRFEAASFRNALRRLRPRRRGAHASEEAPVEESPEKKPI